MSAAELINEATSQGITLVVVNGSVKCRSDKPIPPAIVEKLRGKKADILQLLEGGKSICGIPTNKTWLDDHRAELLAAGFTDRDIRGEGWFSGLADLNLWDKPNLQVELRGDQLCFAYHNGHDIVQQTARPTPWRVQS